MITAACADLRPADRCLITGQPLFCPECGSSLNERGYCACPDWRECSIRDDAEYRDGGPPYPDYGADEPPFEWQHIPEARAWAEGQVVSWCDQFGDEEVTP